MIIYKLKNKETGLYANGGMEFKKLGKSWDSLAEVREHLRHSKAIFSKSEVTQFLDSIEIVKIQIIQLTSFSVQELEEL